MEGRSEKNGQLTITPSSSALPLIVKKKSKLKPGLAIGISFVLMFISVVTMMVIYDFAAAGMLGVKKGHEQIQKSEMNMQKGVRTVQNLCPVHDFPHDCPHRTLHPYPTDFKQPFRDLTRVHRFLRKLRPTQNNTLQATQGNVKIVGSICLYNQCCCGSHPALRVILGIRKNQTLTTIRRVPKQHEFFD
ncbi:unnamed protein product [Arctia plantaginis]|uniref:Uncharacterized protein n=1 Tax=Arctia plantaginis TaxID=874455 RepID=A0A8S0ZLD4_ARCPL|nr:unnamed protein product [Arctia plantaginis]